MADTPSQSSGSLPSWWHDASASSSLCASPSASSEYAAARIDAPTVSAALCRRGFYVLDNFIGIPSAPAAILSGIQELDQAGKMRVGKIQNATTQKVNTQSRTDRIAFLPSPQQSQKKKMPNKASDDERACLTIPASECSEALLAYTRAADAMRVLLTDEDRLVERVGGSLDDCNYMCACYPGGGARYVKHRDALPYKAGRKLTVIYYLNAHWQPGHGGELCIWPADDEHTETPEVVEPRADRLVIFISSLEHEVLPAWRPRYALTTWMFNRKDTALELFAEEMRQKKAQGKFNTAALLAAIDAASSDEEEEAPTPVDGEEMVDRNAALSVVVGLLNRKQSREPATKKVDKPADKAEPPGDKSAAKPRPAIPPPQAPPHGQEFLNLAKTGDLQAMEPLLRANPELLMYNGKVRRIAATKDQTPCADVGRDAVCRCGAHAQPRPACPPCAGLLARHDRPHGAALGRVQESSGPRHLAPQGRLACQCEEWRRLDAAPHRRAEWAQKDDQDAAQCGRGPGGDERGRRDAHRPRKGARPRRRRKAHRGGRGWGSGPGHVELSRLRVRTRSTALCTLLSRTVCGFGPVGARAGAIKFL